MGAAVVDLQDERTGSRARVLAGQGFNCFSFVAMDRGEPVEVLWAEPGFEDGTHRPSSSGIPLLFPFPGRLRGMELNYNGQTYAMEGQDALGNALHGFVLRRPWRVVEATTAAVTGEFHAATDDPSLLDRWPADFLLRVRYELSGNQLISDVEIRNPGDAALPFGFATHPYFRVPLGKAGAAEACRVTVPAARRMELRDMLPTGKTLELDAGHDLRTGLRFGDAKLDDVYVDLAFSGGACETRVDDPATGRTVRQRFDDQFRACVVYTPGNREAVAIEPYTCIPDPFNLQAAGVDSGLRVLQRGETFRTRIVIELLS